MNIELVEIERKKDELFFNIVDKDTDTNVGILFTVGNHVAYEVYPEFRSRGIATESLKDITSRIKSPILEITSDNLASKKVAEKVGYRLTKMEYPFEIYEYLNNDNKTSSK